MESWQIFHVARKELGDSVLCKIFSPRKARAIRGWAQDPTFTSTQTRNPIDRIIILLRELDHCGRGRYARAAIDIMAAPLGGHFEYLPGAKSDRGSVDGELTDAAIALGELATTCRCALADGKLDDEERELVLEAARELYLQVAQLMDALEREAK